MKNILIFISLLVFAFCLASDSWAGDIITPKMALERFEVSHYDGFWHYGKAARPEKGQAGEHGAPLALSFIFLVENPNPFAVTLSGMGFNALFDGFDIVRVSSRDSFWLPPKKTARVRVDAFITANGAFERISGGQGRILAERGISAWDAVEQIWKGAAAYDIGIEIKAGRAEYSDGMRSIVAPFSQLITAPKPVPPQAPDKVAEKAAPKPVKPAKQAKPEKK